jgi:hypothetical protein
MPDTRTKPVVKPDTQPRVNPQQEPVFDPERLCPKQVEKIGI